MATSPDPTENPAVTGVPPETPEDVRPSATGLVTGPVDGETDVEVADVATGDSGGSSESDPTAVDQTLDDAEGGVEGSTLDAPDD
jgi:hypothetical protein